jgi:hypothetical protein
MGVSGQRHAPAALYPRGKDAGARRKILCLCRGSNPDRPARSPTLYCLSYRGSICLFKNTKFRQSTNEKTNVLVSDISGSNGGEYEDCLLGFYAV